ncbi:MAG: LEA type 2 family protein [Luteimonas sp.]|jgi:hypothetical protein
MKLPRASLPLLAAVLLGACASGPPRRVSEPSASVQQLTVRADGSWVLDLRLDNYSNVPMRFDRVDLALTFEGQPAATLQASPALSIGPEAADVATIQVASPPPGARLALADALAGGHRIGYHLEGSIGATPDGSGSRTFEFKRDNALSPVPGLPGVLR